MRQVVLPIKDDEVLKQVEDTLLTAFPKTGRRNYTTFQVGKATMLRVSDVLRLKQSDVFDDYGAIKKNAYIKDKKTKKNNLLYLRPVQQDLAIYQQWLRQQHFYGTKWLFPSIKHPERHITEKQYYKVMSRVGELLNINYLGTHTMRKTGAYRVYMQSNHNIALVMKLLNHSSEQMTLAYLGLDQEFREEMLDKINFN